MRVLLSTGFAWYLLYRDVKEVEHPIAFQHFLYEHFHRCRPHCSESTMLRC